MHLDKKPQRRLADITGQDHTKADLILIAKTAIACADRAAERTEMLKRYRSRGDIIGVATEIALAGAAALSPLDYDYLATALEEVITGGVAQE